MIDVKKDFVRLDHTILAKMLHQYYNEMNGIVLEWIIGYLSNKQQFVYINYISSEHKHIICDIAQEYKIKKKCLFNINKLFLNNHKFYVVYKL